jgi:hypothetical protein
MQLADQLRRKYRATSFRIEESLFSINRRIRAPEEHAKGLLDWILRAQQAAGSGGVPESYEYISKAWLAAYPETTGYIICSLLRATRLNLTPAAVLQSAAVRMGQWLVGLQSPEGGFFGGNIQVPVRQLSVFNTGQILKGFTDLVTAGLDPKGTFRNAAAHAAGWMIGQQDADGAWRRSVSALTSEPVHTYYVRAAWPLARHGRQCGDDSAVNAALKNAEWVLSLQGDDGWFPHMNFDRGETPHTHTIAYTIQGLLEIGVLCGRPDLVAAAESCARSVRALQNPAKGFLPGRIAEGYKTATDWSCTSANSQMAIVWFRLSQITGDTYWNEAAKRAVAFNSSIQDIGHRDPGRRGGIRSAFPGHRGYCCYKYTNWAQKFFLDALMAQLGIAPV